MTAPLSHRHKWGFSEKRYVWAASSGYCAKAL